MWAFLLGVPGKLKAIADTLGAKLDQTVGSRMPGTTTHRDRIDAAISSRAAASTALSNATWTDTKAGYLNAGISSRAAAATALSNATWTDTKAGYLDVAVSSRVGIKQILTGDTLLSTTQGITNATVSVSDLSKCVVFLAGVRAGASDQPIGELAVSVHMYSVNSVRLTRSFWTTQAWARWVLIEFERS